VVGIAYILGEPRPDDLEERLRVLVRGQFVAPATEAGVTQPTFRFVHVLMRDAAYAGLPKRARASLHSRVAEWLERLA
jgi:predicted ATPase